MKFLFELDYKDKKETVLHETLECAGAMDEIAASICRSISLVYAKLLNRGPAHAEAFRRMILVAILSPESPVFKVSPGDAVGNITDISAVIPKPRKE